MSGNTRVTRSKTRQKEITSSASYPDLVEFSASRSSATGEVFEVLPSPTAIDPSMNPTPFSNNSASTSGDYLLEIMDVNDKDSPDSKDAVERVRILFTGNDGTEYLIDRIDVIPKPEGSGDHTFFGGVGLNKVMHGNTGIGTGLVPKVLSSVSTLTGELQRVLLSMGAVNTLKTENEYHVYYCKKIQEGKHHIVVVNVIRTRHYSLSI